MNLTTDQNEIFKKVIADLEEVRQGDLFGEHSLISIKGPAGTGKSYLSKSLVQSLLDKRLSIAVLAPTHQAVGVIKDYVGISHKNLVFSTLHAFLGLKPGSVDLETGERKFKRDCTPKKVLCNMKVDVCILDESSMVGEELYSFLINELYSRNRIKSFLFIGDACQLMPVEKEKDLKTYIHPIYDNSTVNHYSLTELIRNSDPEVIDFVTEIRKMIENKDSKSTLMHFLISESKKEHNKIVFYRDKKEFIKEFIKTDRIGNTESTIASFTNERVNNYNRKLRDYFFKEKTGEVPEISVDDLFVVQEGNEDFINSEILEIESFSPTTENFGGREFKGYYCKTKDGRTFTKLTEESKEDYERSVSMLYQNAIQKRDRSAWKLYYDLKELFLETKYHYSYTFHKLQGSSYKDIWVDCTDLNYVDDSMLLRLFYVGCTRSRNAVHILL